MRKFFERNILDELYELKADKFEVNILKEMSKKEKELSSLESEEKLTKKIKEVVTDEKKLNEILELLNEYELEIGNDNNFWNKMYYKLGVYDCSNMKEIVMNKLDSVLKDENTINFCDNYSEDIDDYLVSNTTKMLNKNEKYKKIAQRIEQIKYENPNVRTFLEDKEAVNLTDVEMNAVLDICELNEEMNSLETKESFKIGAKDMLVFLKKINAV